MTIMTFHSYAQRVNKVTADFNNSTLFDALTQIEQQTDVSFFFKKEWIDSSLVTLHFEEQELDYVLEKLLADQGFSYIQRDKEIILTKDITIIEEPNIARHLTKSSISPTPKGLIFTKDYQEASENRIQLIEVGKRNRSTSDTEATIAGFIKEVATGNPVVGALVYIREPLRSAATDDNGFYSIKLPKGKQTLTIQTMGMKTLNQPIVLFSDGKVDLTLENEVITLDEVTIKADRDANVKNVIMGVSKISVEESKNVPIVLGERDIMKIATTTAGIQTVGEGAAGFNVRGGKSDQNLIMLNNATIYNANHFFGFFSVFNSDAIEGMDIYKSSIPARYGGRLSGVFDIESTPGEKSEFSGVGGVSPITSRLTLKIPIIKDKAGLTIGGRTTYSNWLLKTVNNGSFSKNEVSFGDLILKYDHDLNEENKVSFSAYLSKDDFKLLSDSLFTFSDFGFQNTALSANWNRQFSDKFIGTMTTSYSSYEYLLTFNESIENAFKQNFRIEDFSISTDFSYYLSDNREWNFGAGAIRHNVNPGTRIPKGSESIVQEKKIESDQGLESFLYFSEDYDFNEKLSFSAGLRYSIFFSLGPGSVTKYNDESPKSSLSQIDSTFFDKGEIIKTYHGPELRLSGRYAFNDLTSIKISYNRNRQYLHNLTNSESLSPTDIWRLSDTHILPQIGDQFSLGLYRNVFDKQVEISIESYYKRLQNLVDIKVNSQFLLNNQIETAILQGPGKSYGVEVSVKKSTGKFNGWLNYTYARTFIKLDSELPEETINNGKYYPTTYDKPHTINLIANYKITRRLSLSYNFNYSTGRPVTLPVGVYDFNDTKVLHYSERNAFRIPDYIRMDLGINLEEGHLLKKLSHSYWSFSIYNLLGRDNPFSVFFNVDEEGVTGHKLVVFGNAIPTLSFNFRF